ncbi:spermidine/spermine N(1)-acetyltransferase-like protein 1 [Cricetulus griseus]|uniref:Diamine acetyltransferase 1 n=1 Tax=Cricetulus griseus TaxID=10029 RepID=A0A098KX80_CRIGR|nr:spermidine/spermine N(1)-acetyltransferase-like protein 1 [Cricetulus griseus]
MRQSDTWEPTSRQSKTSTSQLGLCHEDMDPSEESQPETTQLGTNQLETSQPDTTQSGTSELDTSQPDTTQSGQRGTTQSDISERSSSQSERKASPSDNTIESNTKQVVIISPDESQLEPSELVMSDLGINQQRMIQSPTIKECTAPFYIRPAMPEDCPEILRLIKELASHEGRQEEVALTELDLFRDGFGNNPLFYCLIAEAPNQETESGLQTIGFAMYYYTYDTWIGKTLHLEDFYISEKYQGLGIGAEVLKKLSQIAINTQCSAMQFLVVIWNQDSVEYYTRLGASDLSCEEGWHLFRFNIEELLELAQEE